MAGKSKKTVPALAVSPATAAADIDIAAAWAPLFPAMSLDSLADLGRDNVAALIKANLVLSEGLQAIGHEILAQATSALERAGQAATALLGAKTLDEVIQLNSDLGKSALDALVERSTKLSEMGVALATETLAPLGGRVEATFGKFARNAAA